LEIVYKDAALLSEGVALLTTALVIRTKVKKVWGL
jgi:hypothetical protein